MPITDHAPAAEDIPFGSPIRIHENRAYVASKNNMEGIAKRPQCPVHQAHYGRGESVTYQISGEVLALIDNAPHWVTLMGGRVS